MAKRTPVSRLEIDSISTKAIASPVETYVRPAEIQSQPSPLSQFVSAITPVVKAKADKELEIKLKREREIEKNRLASKNFQQKLRMIEVESRIEAEYLKNKQSLIEKSPEQFMENLNTFRDKDLDKLKKDNVDPLIIQNTKNDYDLLNIKYLATFNKDKTAYNNTQINSQFKDTITFVMEKTKKVDGTNYTDEEKVKNILELRIGFAEANPLENGKPNNKRATDALIEHLVSMEDNYDNVLYKALQELKTEKGVALNVLNTAEYRKTHAKIKKSIAKQRATTNATTIKKNAINNIIDTTLSSDKPVQKFYNNGKGLLVKASNNDIEAGLITSDTFAKKSRMEQVESYKNLGFIPDFEKSDILNAYKLLESGVIKGDDLATNTIIQRGFVTYELLRRTNNDLDSFLNETQQLRFEALRYYMEDAGTTGMLDYAVEASEQEGGVGIKSMQNFNNAAQRISQFKLDPDNLPPKPSKLLDDVVTEITPSMFNIFSGETLDEVSNSGDVMFKISQHAHILMLQGVPQDKAIKQAADVARNDYQIVVSGDGKTKYAFKKLNTSLSESLNPSEIITNLNKELYNNKNLAKYLLDKYDLIKGHSEKGYSVGIYPDALNPTQALIRVDKKDGDFFYIFDRVNKVALLNDKDKFINNMLVNVKASEPVQPVTGYGSEIDQSALFTINRFGEKIEYQEIEGDFFRIKDDGTLAKDPATGLIKANLAKEARGEDSSIVTKNIPDTRIKKQSSLLDQINPIGTANASVLDETQVGEFIPSNQTTGDQVTIEGNNIEDKTANMIATQEGFSSTPYKDGSDKSVGFGFFLPALEDDEKALIKDVNNVTKEEGVAVLKLKVQKIGNYLDKEIQGFRNLPEKAQSAVISMGYQLGAPNLKGTWKKFWSALNEASEYAEGSVEQGLALGKAQFNMLFNVAKDGSITATKWATQTTERALEMADAVGSATTKTVEAVASGITNSVIPSAHADTNVPEAKILKIGEQPTADMVSDIAIAVNPVEAAAKYLGISEKESEGAEAVKGFFENIVGDWNPDNETVLDFAGNKAWCAAFLTQVLRDSGFDTDALVSTDKFKQLRASSYAKVGTSVDINQAKAGDIMVKYHTDEEKKKYKAAFGHVGIVYKVDGDQVWFIGGNSGDKVKMASYNHKDKKIDIRRLTKAKDIKTESVPALLDLKLQGQITASNLKNWLKQTKIAEMLDMDN